MPVSLSKSRLLWPTLLTLAALALLVGLGMWQMQRRSWKALLLARIEAQWAQPAVAGTATWPLLACRSGTGPTLGDPCEYQPVKLRGVLDHARERHIFTATPRAPGVPAGAVGYWVFTPLRLEGSARTAYVNRGFVPEPLKDRASRAAGLPTQTVELTGLYRAAQERATFDGANDPARNIWYVRDPAELWPDGGAGPDEGAAYLDVTGPAPDGGWPLPLAGKVEISNRHLEYALTWFGLAGTLVAVFAVFAWGRLRGAG